MFLSLSGEKDKRAVGRAPSHAGLSLRLISALRQEHDGRFCSPTFPPPLDELFDCRIVWFLIQLVSLLPFEAFIV